MKKEYITPSIKVKEIITEQLILAGSDILFDTDGSSDGSDMDSKLGEIWDEL